MCSSTMAQNRHLRTSTTHVRIQGDMYAAPAISLSFYLKTSLTLVLAGHPLRLPLITGSWHTRMITLIRWNARRCIVQTVEATRGMCSMMDPHLHVFDSVLIVHLFFYFLRTVNSLNHAIFASNALICSTAVSILSVACTLPRAQLLNLSMCSANLLSNSRILHQSFL